MFDQPPSLDPPPQYRWLQDVYALDIKSRLHEVLAGITSIYGQFLKLDSTKKVGKHIMNLVWTHLLSC